MGGNSLLHIIEIVSVMTRIARYGVLDSAVKEINMSQLSISRYVHLTIPIGSCTMHAQQVAM